MTETFGEFCQRRPLALNVAYPFIIADVKRPEVVAFLERIRKLDDHEVAIMSRQRLELFDAADPGFASLR